MGITKKQKEVYDYIAEYTDENGFSPTQREIKEHFGFKSFGSVQRYIKYLNEAGYLQADWNARRGLKAVSSNDDFAPSLSDIENIPLLGDVAAGNPIEAIENCDETVSVPRSLVAGPGRYFALKVKGDSMIEDGIFEGDLVICKNQQNANQGQTIVAVVEGEATIKRFYKKGSSIELHPANSSFRPIVVGPSCPDFKIAGVLVGLIRSYL